VEKPEGKRLLGITKCGWVDNIKADLIETRRGCVDWIDLVQDGDNWRALVNVVMNLWVP
jgi:hypothetical protein